MEMLQKIIVALGSKVCGNL